MGSKPPAELPVGTSSTLSALSETFSFHSSPESFITSRVLSFHNERPDLVSSRAVIRAKILNRNVAIVSSARQIRQVLGEDEPIGNNEKRPDCFVARAAYEEFMAPFFPSPNLLLADDPAFHGRMRSEWETRMSSLPEAAAFMQDTIRSHFLTLVASQSIDLYESMKTLAWKLLLGILLKLKHDEKDFAILERLQEDLLRGQFSLFPVSVNAGFWHSPRKRGVDATKKVKAMISERLRSAPNACPFASVSQDHTSLKNNDVEDVANHFVLFTSSLAAKALASLLTAYLLNLHLFELEPAGQGVKPTKIFDKIRELDPNSRSNYMSSVLEETERISPPIVGVLRRCVQDTTLSTPDGIPDVLIPKGWDTWLYFAGAGRDPDAFGEDCEHFHPTRFYQESGGESNPSTLPSSIAFGGGAKACLGRHLVRRIVLTVGEICQDEGIRMHGEVREKGVRGWLGWEIATPDEWAKDIKQIPTQRPARPLMVSISKADR